MHRQLQLARCSHQPHALARRSNADAALAAPAAVAATLLPFSHLCSARAPLLLSPSAAPHRHHCGLFASALAGNPRLLRCPTAGTAYVNTSSAALVSGGRGCCGHAAAPAPAATPPPSPPAAAAASAAAAAAAAAAGFCPSFELMCRSLLGWGSRLPLQQQLVKQLSTGPSRGAAVSSARPSAGVRAGARSLSASAASCRLGTGGGINASTGTSTDASTALASTCSTSLVASLVGTRRAYSAAAAAAEATVSVEEAMMASDGAVEERSWDVSQYLEGLMPKREIGAKRFLDKHPQADGRGTIIAILDSGVDPGAAGLQVTTDGRPKIIDIIDCTGSGDVDTSTVVKADEHGFITGATGRRLQVNTAWSNPSGEWRVGSKRAFQLFTDSLVTRVKRERRKQWDIQHHALLTHALRDLAAFDKANPKARTDDDLRKQRDEKQNRVDLLQSLAEAYDDPGPVIDAVVWHDGSVWRAALDTSDFHTPFHHPLRAATLPPTATATPAAATSSNGITGAEQEQATLQHTADGETVESSVSVSVLPSEAVDKDGVEIASEAAAATGGGESAELSGLSGPLEGRLADCVPLTDYKLEFKYGTLSKLDLCNYSVNIYDHGNVLSIVTEVVSHGTHVAGIAAAHHPEEPELNGVAPGAQIVSCKIGDSRLGSMETPTGIVRALIAVVQHKCDLINMSYGEPVALADYGRIVQLANEVVHKHGVVFVSSAGNEGPALSTVGAPGGTSSAIIGVGAYVSPAMAAAAHSLMEPIEEGHQYTWSSRGPTHDGALGVCISAPGGAVAPVPTSSLQKRMLMNGTSMASPCACGGIALVLSALKQRHPGKPINPHLVRLAIENTALPVTHDAADNFTYGHGLLQVDKALEYLLRCAEMPSIARVRYNVSVVNASTNGQYKRGVYLRDAHETQAPSEWQVFVDPFFHEDADNLEEKSNFEEKVRLIVVASPSTAAHTAAVRVGHDEQEERAALGPGEADVIGASSSSSRVEEGDDGKGSGNGNGGAVSWVKAPEFVLLPHNGRNFFVRVDPSKLPQGAVHYAEVCGVDVLAPWRGTLFRVPITVVRPQLPPPQPQVGEPYTFRFDSFNPGRVERIFVSVPAGATWAEMTVRLTGFHTPRTIVAHTMQVLPKRRHTYRSTKSYMRYAAPSHKTLSCLVEEGSTLELTLAQMWSSGLAADSPASADVEIHFHGMAAVHGDVVINGNAAVQRLEMVAAHLGVQRLVPSVSLNRLRTAYRPTEASIEPLPGQRDTLPNGRQIHALTLTYKVSVSEGGRYTPRFPLLNQRLYDNEYEGQYYMIFDSNKKLVGQEDCYPKGVKLSKGDYVVRFMARHDVVSYLEKLKKMPLLLDRALDDKGTLKLNLYESVDGAITGKDTPFKSAILAPGERKPLFLAGPADDKLPKDAMPGSVLLGRVTVGKLGGPGTNTTTNGNAPARLHVTYIVPQPVKEEKKSSTPPETVELQDKVRDQLRDAKVKILATVAAAEKDKANAMFPGMASDLKEEYPKHLPILTECVRFWDDTKRRADSLDKVVAACDDVIAAIDRMQLALHLAIKTEPEGTQAAKVRKEREAEKEALVDALYRKGLALADLAKPTSAAAAADAAAASSTLVLQSDASTPSSSAAAAASAAFASGGGDTTASGSHSGAATADADAADLFEANYLEFCKWADVAQPKYALLLVLRDRRAGRPASALKVLQKMLEDDGKAGERKLHEMKVELMEEAGWPMWAQHETAWNAIRFPPMYPLF